MENRSEVRCLGLGSPKNPLAGGPRRAGAGRVLLAALGWLWLVGFAAHGQRPTLRLDLLAVGMNPDPTYVYFEPGAATSFDPNFDATKLPNSSGLNLASFKSGGQAMAINGLPPAVLSAPFTVPLFVGVPQDGTYVLQVGQLTDFATTGVSLTDDLLNTRVPLAPGTIYAFDVTAANTNGTYATSTRFALQFTPPPAPLPVVLTRFMAEAEPAGVRVAWATASELRSAYFAVERSADGRMFGEIGRVAAAGTSAQAHAYALLDVPPPAGVAYYRLRQVDTDGSVQYSPVRAVVWRRGPDGPRVFPNPACAAATLLGAAPGAPVEVVDGLGRRVSTAIADALGSATLALPAGLAGGVYVVRVGAQAARLTVEPCADR